MDSSHKQQNYVCRSEVVSKPFTFRWEIDRFPLRLMKIGDEYPSPEFEVGDGVPAFVGLRREKDDADGVEGLSIYLCNASKEKSLKLDFSLTIFNSQPGKSIADTAPENRLLEPNTDGDPFGCGWKSFVPFASVVDKAGGFLKDGHRLTLLIKGTVFLEKPDAVKREDNHYPVDAASGNEDFGKLFDEGEFSDFVVKAKNSDDRKKEFKVHKLILAKRSKYFAAMFSQSEAKECREGVLDVDDIDSEAMESLLRFLYTGKTPPETDSEEDEGNIGKELLELLIAADKYGILGLKSHLERVLAAKLSVENVCAYFVIAARHSAPFLAERCREFIRGKAGEVAKTDGWGQLCAQNAELVAEIIVP